MVMSGSKFINHTVPGQALGKPPEAVYQYLVPNLLPVNDNLVFLNQWKRESFSRKECAGHEVQSRDRLRTQYSARS